MPSPIAGIYYLCGYRSDLNRHLTGCKPTAFPIKLLTHGPWSGIEPEYFLLLFLLKELLSNICSKLHTYYQKKKLTVCEETCSNHWATSVICFYQELHLDLSIIGRLHFYCATEACGSYLNRTGMSWLWISHFTIKLKTLMVEGADLHRHYRFHIPMCCYYTTDHIYAPGRSWTDTWQGLNLLTLPVGLRELNFCGVYPIWTGGLYADNVAH